MVMTVGHDLLEIKDQEGQAKGGVTFTECTDRQDWIDACKPLYESYAAGLDSFIADIQSYK